MYANDRVKRTTKMEVYNTKGARVIIMSPLAVFAIMLMILLNGYGCAAVAVLVKTNTTFRCDGRLDECLLEDDLQFEFLMNPYVSRVLGASTGTSTASLNAEKPVYKDCKPAYNSCVHPPEKKDNHPCDNPNVYSKSCGNQPSSP